MSRCLPRGVVQLPGVILLTCPSSVRRLTDVAHPRDISLPRFTTAVHGARAASSDDRPSSSGLRSPRQSSLTVKSRDTARPRSRTSPPHRSAREIAPPCDTSQPPPATPVAPLRNRARLGRAFVKPDENLIAAAILLSRVRFSPSRIRAKFDPTARLLSRFTSPPPESRRSESYGSGTRS